MRYRQVSREWFKGGFCQGRNYVYAKMHLRIHIAASHLGLRCLLCSFYACIQPVPQVRSLNFSLATPLFAHMRILTIVLSTFVFCCLENSSDSAMSDMIHYQNLKVLARMLYCFLSPNTANNVSRKQ